MSKLYKTMSTCSMCKQRFSVVKEEGRSPYSSSTYCPACLIKYFPKKAAEFVSK